MINQNSLVYGPILVQYLTQMFHCHLVDTRKHNDNFVA